jgi:hypothetical protein
MNRVRFLGLSAALAVPACFVPVASRAASGAGKRSLWVWQTSVADAGSVAEFARANGFGTLFLSVKADRSALAAGDASALAGLTSLGAAGLTVYGVAGDPEWVKKERSDIPKSVNELLDIHASHGVFSGIALDIEPHTLPEWQDDSRKAAIAANFINVLARIRTAAAAAHLPVLATVHPTYAKYSPPGTGEGTLLQAAARAVDATDLTAYRNAESTLERFGSASMAQLAGVGKPWWLGVSTHSNAPAGTSYATLPASQFFPDIDATSAKLTKRYGVSFAGIAVEDYRNTVALLR